MRDGVVCEIGCEPLSTVVPEPLFPTTTLREQALAAQAERAVEAERCRADGIAREKERGRRNEEREQAEFVRRQEALSK
jgi:hypothetical protein